MVDLTIWIVGGVSRAELREALAVFAGREVREWTTIDALAALLEGAAPPDLVVLVENRPGEITHEQLEALRHLAPLTRMVGLLGSWCEGETRTGQPWSGVMRLYWHQFAARMRGELERFDSGDATSWSRPLTDNDEWSVDTLLSSAEYGPPDRGLEGGRHIAIVAETRVVEEHLHAICRSAGFEPTALSESRDELLAIVWDIPGSIDAGVLEQGRELAADGKRAKLIAVVGFLRAEDAANLRTAGVTAILSKPLVIDELARTLVSPASRAVSEGHALRARH